MAHSMRHFTNAGGSPSAQEMYRSTKRSLDFTPDAFSPFGYQKRAFNNFYLRDYLNPSVCLMRWRSGTGIFVFTDSFGDLNLLNASCSTLRIRRR